MKVAVFTFCALVLAVPAWTECNTAPVTANQTVEAFDEPLVIDVLASSNDPEGHALSVTATTTCTAVVTVDEFHLVHFVPNPEVRTDCLVSFTVTDELGLADTGTVTVTVVSGIFADGFESGDTAAWSETVN